MSVINQLLLDLEKRRASGAERSTLPSHVRALPEGEREVHWGWIAAGGTAAVAVLAGSWALLSGFDWARQGGAAFNVPRHGTEVAIERVVAATAGVTPVAKPEDESDGVPKDAPASRLSFELSSLPERPPSDARAPLPTARVVGRGGRDAGAGSESTNPTAGRTEVTQAAAVVASAKAPATKPEIQKEVRQPTQRELAENEYRKATVLLHQGRLADAQEGYQAALNLYPGYHGARQALVGLLLEGKKNGEAERVLQEGLVLAPAQTGFAMTLARLQVDRGDAAQASATLKKGLENAQGNADYLAFFAALQQRQGRHEEAIEQFQAALRLRPGAGVWWLGLGISLQAANRKPEAQDAYRRARASNNLNPELAAFADQRLTQLQ